MKPSPDRVPPPKFCELTVLWSTIVLCTVVGCTDQQFHICKRETAGYFFNKTKASKKLRATHWSYFVTGCKDQHKSLYLLPTENVKTQGIYL